MSSLFQLNKNERVIFFKRLRILKTHKNRAVMNEDQIDNMFPDSMKYEVVNRIIWRNHTNARKILLNVCKGQFPGKYS